MTIALGDAGSVGVDAGRLGRIDALMQDYVDRGVYAGIVTMVARRGTVVHAGTYGWSDRERRVRRWRPTRSFASTR